MYVPKNYSSNNRLFRKDMLVARLEGLFYYKFSRTLSDFVLANAPGSADGYFVRGVDYLEEDGGDNAALCFSQAIEIDPNFVQAYNNRGIANALLGNKQRAEDDFIKSSELAFIV